MKKYTLLLSGFFLSINAPKALGLSEYLESVLRQNPRFESLNLDAEAVDLGQVQGDLELSPYLSAETKWSVDENPFPLQQSPFLLRTKNTGEEYSIGLNKKFSFGTQLAVGLGQRQFLAQTASGPQPDPFLGNFYVSLSQPLWKDFLGKQVRNRRNREEGTQNLEKTIIRVEGLQTLNEAELAYWNLIYQLSELKIRQDSLRRADRLVKWSRGRVSSGVAQVNDLLQVEALFAQRELQLIGSQDAYQSAQKELKRFMNLPPDSADLVPTDSLDLPRAGLIEKLDAQKTLRADALLAKFESQISEASAQETLESLKPDLRLQASYAMNSMEDKFSDSLTKSLQNEKVAKSVGLSLVMDLDFAAKRSLSSAARIQARSRSIKRENLAQESQRDIFEIKRRYADLSRRIESVKKLLNIQRSKFEKEQERLNNGRSTTFQVVSFEQEIAEGELLLTQLLSEQRKLESSSRLFVEKL